MEECTHMLSSQRRISSSQAMEVDLADGFGISLKSTYELMVKQVGGRKSLGYTRLNQKNYIRMRRQKANGIWRSRVYSKLFL